MIANLLPLLRDAGPSIADHLWQSTVFILGVSLLTLLFRSHRARIRHGLWLAASIKLLVPFSLLIALGSVIPISNRDLPQIQRPLVSAIQIVDQPFSARITTQDVETQPSTQHFETWMPAVLVSIWALGFSTVLLVWYARWRRISKILKSAIPIEDRRELRILRRIESDTNPRIRTQFLISSDLMEPGIFGIFRPVLLWPSQLSTRLEDSHLEAILAHEVAHVQRRDNLTATIHMAVEAIFWFHPLVWWIEHRILEERERACDESVVLSGGRAEIYADSLLRVSRFCAELSLPCVSGITGADLSERIRSIMVSQVTEIGIGKKLLLGMLAFGVVASPLAFGLMQNASHAEQILHATGPLPSFEVASIKPNRSGSGFAEFRVPGMTAPKDRFIATDTTIKGLILWAWAPGTTRPLPDDQVVGGPSWINSERYDIDAALQDSQVAALEKLAPWDRSVQVKLMVQSLLASRFKLVLNDGATAPRPVYALVIAKGGPKLQETLPGSNPPPNTFPAPPLPPPGATTGHAPASRAIMIGRGRGDLKAFAIPISDLARYLQGELGRPVLDHTGLTGNYNFSLKWTPDLNSAEATPEPSQEAKTAPPDGPEPSIFTALQEQLGLKLESTKDTEEAIAIVHIEKPSEN